MAIEAAVKIPVEAAKFTAKATAKTAEITAKVAAKAAQAAEKGANFAKKGVEKGADLAKKGAETGRKVTHAGRKMAEVAGKGAKSSNPDRAFHEVIRMPTKDASAGFATADVLTKAKRPVARHPGEAARRIAPKNETPLAKNHVRTESKAARHPNEAVRKETPKVETPAKKHAKSEAHMQRHQQRPHRGNDNSLTRAVHRHESGGSTDEKKDERIEQVTVVNNRPLIQINTGPNDS
jgi:hypothetical protein